MHDVIFLGYVIRPEEANTVTGASVAGNKMQWNVVRHLSGHDDLRVHCVTVMPLAPFPRDRKLWQGRQRVQLTEKVASTRIAFMNVPVIKQVWQTAGVYREARRLQRKYPDAVVMSFNLFPQVGIPLRRLGKKAPTVCLLADLPMDERRNRRGLSLWLRGMYEKSAWKSMDACERFIVLNPHAAELFLHGKPYMVVDGGVDEEEIPPLNRQTAPKEHNLLFSGALAEYNGVRNLMAAMDLIDDDDIVLDIYGDGYLRGAVEEAARKNPHIRYHGRVANETVMQKQREAWGLINPRVVDDPIAKVTFPSKTFEYLLSGTPVISTRLNGYGPEYEGCMLFARQDTPEGIAAAIRQMAAMPEHELKRMTCQARSMVCSQKSWEVQAGKIKRFITAAERGKPSL